MKECKINNNIMNQIDLNKININYNENSPKFSEIINVGIEISIAAVSPGIITIFIPTSINDKVGSLVDKLILKVGCKREDLFEYRIEFHERILDLSLTVAEAGLKNGSKIFITNRMDVKGANGPWYDKEINIKFIKVSKNTGIISHCQLVGLLKLCLLKEISAKLSDDNIEKLPNIIGCIMKILKKGYIETSENIKETIKEVLKKMKGSNILNFSYYVDETIDMNQTDKLMKLLDKDDFKKINDIRYRLSKYNKYIEFFNKKFEKAKKESIFEFSVVSLIIIEREDFEKFEQERSKCPNRVDKILYHGTSVEPISCILTDFFKKSVDRSYQHGKGVYFTDFLDYCWFYGGQESNRANKNRIPGLNDTFTLITCCRYYNKKGYRKVTDYKYTPKKMK